MAKIKIEQISTPGCPTCVWSKDFLEREIRPNFPGIEIEYLTAASEKGRELIQKHSIFAAPGLIVNGKLFSTGSYDKENLIEKIKTLL
jgi:glutaredoxin